MTTLAVAISAPFVSRLTARLEPRSAVSTAALLLALPTLMTAYADSFAEVLMWRFVEGMLIPVVFATSVAYIGERWRGGTVTEITSLYVAGTVLGGFAGRFVTGVMTEYVGWREAFELLAVLSLMVGGFIQFLLPAGRPRAMQVEAFSSGLFRKPLVAAYAVGFLRAVFPGCGVYLRRFVPWPTAF